MGTPRIAEEPLVQEYVKLEHDAPDTMRVRIVETAGLPCEGLIKAKFLSLSIRIAVTGQSNNLLDDLRLVFSECALIPGYAGYVIGVNDVLEEEDLWHRRLGNQRGFRTKRSGSSQCSGSLLRSSLLLVA